MGFNVSVTIVDDVCARLQSGGTTLDGHTVHQSGHAGATRLIAVGNCSTKVFTMGQSVAHHTEAGQGPAAAALGRGARIPPGREIRLKPLGRV